MPRWEEMTTDALFRELRRSSNPDLRSYLIKAHDGLVRHVAKEYINKGESLEDLLQVGRLGLINAVDRFDPERGTQFATYAVPTIDGEIKRYFRDKGWSSLKVPRRIQELVLQVKRTIDQLSAQNGRSPTYQEVADAIGVTEEEVIEAVELGQQYEPLSMQGGLMDEEGGEMQLDERAGMEDPGLENLGEREAIQAALDQLPARERLIIQLRFFNEMSQSDIAKRLGISQMHVSRLQHRALARLRRLLQDAREPLTR